MSTLFYSQGNIKQTIKPKKVQISSLDYFNLSKSEILTTKRDSKKCEIYTMN